MNISKSRRTAQIAGFFCMVMLLGLLLTGCRSRGNESGLISPGPDAATPRPTAAPVPSAEPSLPDDAENRPLEQVYDKIRQAYGDRYLPGQQLDAAELERTFGIGTDLYEQFVAEKTDDDESPHMLVLIEARDGKEAEIRQKLEAYRQKMIDNGEHTERYTASKVHTDGKYVFYVMLGTVDDDTLSGEGLMEALGKEIDKGIRAIRDFFSTGSMPDMQR